ncbi:MAG TPA: hypothetical protein DE315_08435 [Candidatus Omnitrophica bacterium]|nr:MAG: hypothetical protein A2Y05_01415 [Omnitrophica WOR_2 bacterium GWA2_53_43]HCI45537.1 hypothetical protein [Candidatus Omnitrophota bacterium]
MKSNSLGLQILWWAEIVVGARALLFLVPVMISKWQVRSLSPSSLEDWFLWVAMVASALYFFIGIASLAGHKLWRVFHAVAMVIVALLTLGLWNISGRQQVSLPLFCLLPAVGALCATAAAYSIKVKIQRA